MGVVTLRYQHITPHLEESVLIAGCHNSELSRLTFLYIIRGDGVGNGASQLPQTQSKLFGYYTLWYSFKKSKITIPRWLLANNTNFVSKIYKLVTSYIWVVTIHLCHNVQHAVTGASSLLFVGIRQIKHNCFCRMKMRWEITPLITIYILFWRRL